MEPLVPPGVVPEVEPLVPPDVVPDVEPELEPLPGVEVSELPGVVPLAAPPAVEPLVEAPVSAPPPALPVLGVLPALPVLPLPAAPELDVPGVLLGAVLELLLLGLVVGLLAVPELPVPLLAPEGACSFLPHPPNARAATSAPSNMEYFIFI